jgi:hypothetical protein
MRKGFLIYEEMRKYFPIYEVRRPLLVIYDFAFLTYEENFIFFLISAAFQIAHGGQFKWLCPQQVTKIISMESLSNQLTDSGRGGRV